MNPARYTRVKATSGAVAKAAGICKTFTGSVLLYRESGADIEEVESTGIHTCINCGTTDIEAGDIVDVVQDISGFWLTPERSAEAAATPAATEVNPGVLRATLTGETACTDEADSGIVYEATIGSRPWPCSGELRRENSGTIVLHDPSGCVADLPTADMVGANFWAFLSCGGKTFDWGFNFRSTEIFVTDGVKEIFVAAGTAYGATYDTECWLYGWQAGTTTAADVNNTVGPNLAGYHTPVVEGGSATFRVDLPEKGTYNIELAAGNIDIASVSKIEVYDGGTLITSMEVALTAGQHVDILGDIHATLAWTTGIVLEHDFQSSNRPQFLIKIYANATATLATYLNHVRITQTGTPSRWEAITRCCLPADFAEQEIPV